MDVPANSMTTGTALSSVIIRRICRSEAHADTKEMTDAGDDDWRSAVTTVASGGVLVFVARVVAVTIGLLTQIVMARLLSPTGYGSVILVIAVLSFAEMFASVGIDDGVTRKVPVYEDTPSEVRGIARAAIRIVAGAGVIVAGMVFVSAPALAKWVFNASELTLLLRVIAISVPFTVAGRVGVGIARGIRDARPHAYITQIVRPGARFVLVTVFIVSGFGAIGAVAGIVSAAALAGVLAVVVMYRLLPASTEDEPTASMWRELLYFSAPLIVTQGMLVIFSNTDTLMIGYYLETAFVGAYDIAYRIRDLMHMVIVTVGYLLPPVLARLEQDGKQDQMNRVYQMITKWTTFLTFPLFFLFFFFPAFYITLVFGAEYVPGANALRILSVAGLVSAIMGANRSALIGLDRNRTVMYTMLVSAIINVVLNVVLIPVFGITGAAIASLVAVLSVEVLNVSILYREFGILPLPLSGFGPVLAALVVSAGLVSLFGQDISPLVFSIVVVAIVYPGVLVLTGGLGTEDWRLFNQLRQQFLS